MESTQAKANSIPIYLGCTAMAAGLGYLIYSTLQFSSRSKPYHSSPAKPSSTTSQLEYEEQGVLDIFQYDKKYRHLASPTKGKNFVIPKGLPNYGNTCYLNALLQSLTACDEFGAYLSTGATLSNSEVSVNRDLYLSSLSKLLTSSTPFL